MSGNWTSRREGGSPRALQALLGLVLRLGARNSAALLLPPITAWYLATRGEARAASREFLTRALGRRARLSEVAHHLHGFAHAVLDRVFLLADRTADFEIRVEGLEHVSTLLDSGQGCILLGAHLGSFEALRSLGRQAPVPVHPVMYRRNAGALTVMLDSLAPGLRHDIIEIGEPGSMLRAREALERGEIVGLLADRSPRGEKTVAVPFLGSPAAFPAGPFILAATLAAPVVLFFGLRTGPQRYTIRFQPFAGQIVLRRATRAADLAGWVAAYAAALEPICRAHPYNWFNFFPFWAHNPDA